MKILILSLFIFALNQVAFAGGALLVDQRLLWKNSKNITVCFESIEYLYSTDRKPIKTSLDEISDTDKQLYNEAKSIFTQSIQEQFNNIPQIGFTGFGNCPVVPSQELDFINERRSTPRKESKRNLYRTQFDGVRVFIRKKAGGVAAASGESARGLFMGLTLGIEKDEVNCNSKWQLCFIHGALHEMGHILGLGHEHERMDAPSCKIGVIDGEVWKNFTSTMIMPIDEYDPLSIMNYCANTYYLTNPIQYTEGDLATLKKLYTQTELDTVEEPQVKEKNSCVNSGGTIQIMLLDNISCCDRTIKEATQNYTPYQEEYNCVTQAPLGGWPDESK